MPFLSRILDAKTPAEREEVSLTQTNHRDHVTYTRNRFTAYMQLAEKRPDLFLVAVVDGMDSKKAQVPRCRSDAVYSKDVESSGKPLDTRLVGAHLPGRWFHGFWTYPNFVQGGSAGATVLHRVLCAVLKRERCLPRVFIVLMDNTCKENKNNCVIKYLALLVFYGVFDEVIVVFLLVGHTHSIIDQRFSVISRHLSARDATTLAELIRLVAELKLGQENPADNEHVEVKQALDWGWLLSNDLTWYIQGFGTKTVDGVKHAVHAIRLSMLHPPLKTAGTVVFQYKEHDRPGPWLGHYQTNEPLPVFKKDPDLPSRTKVLPRQRNTDLPQVRLKVNSLLVGLKDGEGEEGPQGDAANQRGAAVDQSGFAAIRGRVQAKSFGTRPWWDRLFQEEEQFWSSHAAEVKEAAQVVDPADEQLQSWLPQKPSSSSSSSSSRPFRQPFDFAMRLQARQALEQLDRDNPVPPGLTIPDDFKWVGRKGIPDEVPVILDTFNPQVDLKADMVVLMTITEGSTLDRGWELAVVTSVGPAENEEDGSPAGKAFAGIYLRPDIPGRKKVTGFQRVDWPNEWTKLPLTQFTKAQLPDGSKRVQDIVWDFKGMDVDFVVIGFIPGKSKKENAWKLTPTQQKIILQAVATIEKMQQQQQQQRRQQQEQRQQRLTRARAAGVATAEAVRSAVTAFDDSDGEE